MRLGIGFRQFDGSFWRYVASYSIFSVGVFVFTELYPLYLQDSGATVVLIGNASLAMNVGLIAGTIPAVFLIRLLGLRGTNMLSLAGASLASVARLWHTNALMVYGGAFVAGFFFAVLTVGIAVTVSRLTVPTNRVKGFTWFFSVTIVAGFLGDAIGGEVPGWIEAISGGETPGQPKLVAALLANMISVASVIPAATLRFTGEGRQEKLNFPRGPAIVRLMISIAVWNFAVGLFAPFYTLYFSTNLGASVRTIGLELASGQGVGAVFTILAPMVVARWGTGRSVSFMMFAAGACSCILSVSSSMAAAALGYGFYMGFVAMVQPPLNALLMNMVSKEEQAGASMLNSLSVFSAVAAGGFVGGRLIDALGYPAMLALAGASGLFAGLVFVVLVKADPVAGGRRITARSADK